MNTASTQTGTKYKYHSYWLFLDVCLFVFVFLVKDFLLNNSCKLIFLLQSVHFTIIPISDDQYSCSAFLRVTIQYRSRRKFIRSNQINHLDSSLFQDKINKHTRFCLEEIKNEK